MRLTPRSLTPAVLITAWVATAIPLQGCTVLTAAVAGAAAGSVVGYGLAYSSDAEQSPVPRDGQTDH